MIEKCYNPPHSPLFGVPSFTKCIISPLSFSEAYNCILLLWSIRSRLNTINICHLLKYLLRWTFKDIISTLWSLCCSSQLVSFYSVIQIKISFGWPFCLFGLLWCFWMHLLEIYQLEALWWFYNFLKESKGGSTYQWISSDYIPSHSAYICWIDKIVFLLLLFFFVKIL